MGARGGDGAGRDSDAFAEVDHPWVDSARLMAAAIRGGVPGVVESVKWNAPNYALEDDFATFSLRRPDLVQLILHTGARPKPDHPEIVLEDPPAFLRVAARNRVVLSFRTEDALLDAIPEVERLVRAWSSQLVGPDSLSTDR